MATLKMTELGNWDKRCSAVGCDRKTRSGSADLCEKHYQRKWRSGTPDGKINKETYEHSGGYIIERVEQHPLETSGNPGFVYQHRRVFYDAKGEGPFNCHVCDEKIGWDNMHVDHLDDDVQNNDIANLAPACPTCNQWRGRAKMIEKKRAAGRLLTAFGKTQCLTEWAREVGVQPQSIAYRIRSGWPLERALSVGGSSVGPARTKDIGAR